MISPTGLRHARILAGLSQRELAKRVGLNYQIIRRAELDRPTPSITLRELAKLADKLGISPATLLQTPTSSSRGAVYDTDELSVSEARLLRGLETGRRSTRSLTRVEREVHLPRLRRQGLPRQGPVAGCRRSAAPWTPTCRHH
jgi:transcriptional regulator with XRE-family HTH domain